MNNQDTVTALNGILADMHVLIAKLHHYHWNISGMQFPMVHAKTEAYYDYFFAQFDEVAERILQIDGKPLTTVKAYLANATLKEDETPTFDAKYVLDSISADFKHLLSAYKSAFEKTESSNDIGTQDLLGGLIAWIEKELWLIRSTIAS